MLQGMAFGWEFVMTFLLVAVVFAVAIGKPSFTETGPLAVGFALWCSAFAGGFTASLRQHSRPHVCSAVRLYCNWASAGISVQLLQPHTIYMQFYEKGLQAPSL